MISHYQSYTRPVSRYGRTPPISRLPLALLVAAFLPFVMPVEAETDPAELLQATYGNESLIRRLGDLLMTFQQAGLEWEEDALFEQLATTLVQRLDPQGGLDNEAAISARQRRRSGWVYAPGLRLATTNDTVVIADVHPDKPAAEAGLQPGVVVRQVDTHDAGKRGLFQLEQALRSDEAKPLNLVLGDEVDGVRTQRVDRVAIQLPAVDRAEALPFDLGYIRINRLRAETGAEVADQIHAWQEKDFYGLLLDLRDADGYDWDSIETIATLFAEEGALLYTVRDGAGQDIRTAKADAPPVNALPLMVLVDEDTRGGAEVLAAILRDSVRGAMLFGRPTAGDFLLQETLVLPDDTRIRLATRELITGNGSIYTGGTGLTPAVHTATVDPQEHKPVRSGRTELLDEEIAQEHLFYRIRGDATLRRAVDVLLGLKALGIELR